MPIMVTGHLHNSIVQKYLQCNTSCNARFRACFPIEYCIAVMSVYQGNNTVFWQIVFSLIFKVFTNGFSNIIIEFLHCSFFGHLQRMMIYHPVLVTNFNTPFKCF